MKLSRTHYIKALIHAGDDFWQKTVILLIITCTACAIDAVTVYSIFESLFTETVMLLIATTFGSTVVLDVIPMFIARLVQCVRFRKSYKRPSQIMHLILLGISSVGFVLFFIFFAKPRFATVDQLFQSSNMSSTLTNEAAQGQVVASEAQKMTIWVLIFVNACTSIATFICALLCNNPIRMRRLIVNVEAG